MPGVLEMGVGTLGGRVVVACCRRDPRRLLCNLHVSPGVDGEAMQKSGGYSMVLDVALAPRSRLDQLCQKRFVFVAGSVCARDKQLHLERFEASIRANTVEQPSTAFRRPQCEIECCQGRVWSVADPCS